MFNEMLKRYHITILGCVQGVGFRPFIYRLARRHQLSGTIKNTNAGVFIDVQGPAQALSNFRRDILSEKPVRAVIAEVLAAEMPMHTINGFEIIESDDSSSAELPLLPDTAICQECLRELFDPKNRRYLYPFVHCVSCGPRFSLFLKMPFDRANTSMKDFTMCPECRKEYTNPEDRRFFSQTNCCPECGPKMILRGRGSTVQAHGIHAINAAVEFLNKGMIVSIKNTGGHQLLADATHAQAVHRLRTRKKRPYKPFALLMPSLKNIQESVRLTHAAEGLLSSPAAPIVLLPKLVQGTNICPLVSSESPYHGMMLPHNAIQHMISKSFGKPLVATSGNLSGGPLCIDNEESLSKLGDIADFFLLHDRQIIHALDDSIVHIIEDRPMLVRRARGYIPYALPIPNYSRGSERNLMAAGAQLKNTFSFSKGNMIYLSQHVGDLDTVDTCVSYGKSIEKWENLLLLDPKAGVGDRHPDYYTREYLRNRFNTVKQVQHHKAHVLAGMAENQLQPPFLGVAWDGTGFGDDGTVWGGEIFLVDPAGMSRIASLYPFQLPGGEKAIREPRRCGLGLLYATYGRKIPEEYKDWLETAFDADELGLILQALDKRVHSPVCSSIGRLFDGISAWLGCCKTCGFEGHAAMMLEAQALNGKNTGLRYSIPLMEKGGMQLMDWRGLLPTIFADLREGIDAAEIAYAFHAALSDCIVEIARIAGQQKVLLTGGVMQNKVLAEDAIAKLRIRGGTPYWHQHIPPNDGGISVGQLMAVLNENIRY